MTETFSPPKTPDFGLTKTTSTRVLRADFGDGYSLRAGDGLNSTTRSVPLLFSVLSPEEASSIESFFEARAGVEAFYYTMPFEGEPRLWIASSWTRTWDSATTQKVSVTLTEEFDVL